VLLLRRGRPDSGILLSLAIGHTLLYVALFRRAGNTGNNFLKRNCGIQWAGLLSVHISS
jgi:hypothetical protein